MKNDTENTDESILRNLNSTGGFNTPKDYFETSKIDIMAKIGNDFNLESAKMENGFTVPANYFEENKLSILSKTNQVNAKKVHLINWKFVSGIAAILVAIMVVFIYQTNQNANQITVSKLTDNELIEYLAANDIKEDLIREVGNNLKTNTEESPEIEQYLIEHADVQTLLEEL